MLELAFENIPLYVAIKRHVNVVKDGIVLCLGIG